MAMGGAGVAVVGGPERQRWNPAGLRGDGTALEIDHTPVFAGLSHEWVGLAAGHRAAGARYALSFAMLRSDPIEARDAEGMMTGELAAYGAELGLTVAVPLWWQGARFGATLKAIREVLGEAGGFGAAVDLGLLLERGNGRLGIVMAHLGPDYRFDGGRAPLPREWRIGGALHWRDEGLLIAADLHVPAASYVSVHLGSEWRLHSHLHLLAGYRLEPAAPAELALDGPTFGFAATLFPVTARYAYVTPGGLEPSHRLGLGFDFGRPRR
jgi:hypothetical protein